MNPFTNLKEYLADEKLTMGSASRLTKTLPKMIQQ
jgi:hypothetical protein